MIENKTTTGFLMLLLFASSVVAEPWIDTRDEWLRADIELLADAGIITVPVTTYPLMWAGIIQDIDERNIEEIPRKYKTIYWRVKKAGKKAMRKNVSRELKISAANSSQVFRSFGDEYREKGELSARKYAMGKNYALNIEVTNAIDPYDDEKIRYDGSYFAFVWGNWVTSVGAVEKWWGASWDSANLLSNNARPPIGIAINRNYSQPSEFPALSWIGSWNLSSFIGQLDTTEFHEKPFLSGVSISIKPHNTFEVSIRKTAISGGKEKVEAIDDSYKSLTGLDLRWTLPLLIESNLPTSFYLSVTDEGQAGHFSSTLIGVSTGISVIDEYWRLFAEVSDTRADGLNLTASGTTYEHINYANGYRFKQRAIGSTYDNNSKVFSLGVVGKLSRYQSFTAKVQNIELNNGTALCEQGAQSCFSNHSLTRSAIKANRFALKWQWQMEKDCRIDIEVDYITNMEQVIGDQKERYRINLVWVNDL